MLLPLVLAQFICSYAASNMNVAISGIATDLGTTVSGVQTGITLFTLTMAALMIPGSKLSDICGRKVCFTIGLAVYGAGALIAAAAPGLGVLIVGYSLLEGHRYGAADPAGLHPGDRLLRGRHVAGARVRLDQRRRRHRLRRRAR